MSQRVEPIADRTEGRFARAVVRVAIIAMVILIVVMTAMVDFADMNSRDRSRLRVTEASMSTVRTAINAFKADRGRYPQTLDTLVAERYFEKPVKDGWKQEFRYAAPGANGKDYTLVSAGEDGEFGTEDDINVWRID